MKDFVKNPRNFQVKHELLMKNKVFSFLSKIILVIHATVEFNNTWCPTRCTFVNFLIFNPHKKGLRWAGDINI